MLIAVDKLEQSERRFASLDAKPAETISGKQTLEESLLTETPDILTADNLVTRKGNLAKRIKMLSALQQEPLEFAFERSIGANDSVYSNFIELTANAKRKVGRIAIKDGNRNLAFATGFMVSENLLLTNWHVFKTKGSVADSEVQFFYELDIDGHPGLPTIFKLNADEFFYSFEDLDYCFVAVEKIDITGETKLEEIGYISLDPTLGKLGNENEEALNIVHHPDGDYKQLSIRENLFTHLTPATIWYRSDTAPGSSGSPVFNDQWQVVALHHSGVGRKNAAGEYIDKDGHVIPLINGKVDAAKIVWDANEGVRISVILKHVSAQFPGHPLIEALEDSHNLASTPGFMAPMPQPSQEVKSPSIKTNEMEPVNTAGEVKISFPASLIAASGVINININHQDKAKQPLPVKAAALHGAAVAIVSDPADLDEIKELEQAVDYAACKGYRSKFLGMDIPLPQPQTKLKKFLAEIPDSGDMELKYHHYSVLFHTVRMMPVISAINVDGDFNNRKDKTKRKDVWLRDTRLDFDLQLNDKYYRASGFDRGHMSRREDANWGTTAENAKLNADLTCVYTNACPQVAKINQSHKNGLWGKLETVVLEKGLLPQPATTNKISVFSGPVFKDDDPVFRGIQVPMDFYKIVLWLTDNDQIKATAFRLTQQKLISDIRFEQLNIDQNTEFKEQQCSILSLQKATQLDFSVIIPLDTFEGQAGEEIALNTAEEVALHIAKHNKRN